MQDQLAAERAEIDRIDRRERRQVAEAETDRQTMATKRWADAPSKEGSNEPAWPPRRARPQARFRGAVLVVLDLRLYVTGQSPNSIRAIENLRRVCEEHMPGRYQIEVVDLLENPRLAADDQILAVPTVVRKLPVPIRKIVGDLSDTDRLLVGLQVRIPGKAST